MANTPNFALYKPNRADTSVEVDTSLSDNFTKIDTELQNNKGGLAAHITEPNAHTSENISHEDGSVKTTLDNHEERLGAVDDLETRVDNIETLGLDVLAPNLEGRISTIESDVEGILAPATFEAMNQQSYTFDEYRIGYVDNKLAKHYSVVKLTGNEIADDTAAIQAAIDKDSAVGAWTVIPKGNYKVTNTLILKKGTRLLMHKDARIVRYHSGNIFQNGVSGDLVGQDDVTVIGGKLDLRGHILNGPSDDGSGLSMGYAKNIWIRDVEIYNCYYSHAIELCALDTAVVENCGFYGYIIDAALTRNMVEAIQIERGTSSGFPWFGANDNTPCRNIRIYHCIFGASDVAPSWPTAVGTHQNDVILTADNIEIIGCVTKDALTYRMTQFRGYKNVRFERNVMTAYRGVTVYDDGATVSKVSLKDNKLTTTADVGVYIEGVDGFNSEGNTVNSYTTGLYLNNSDNVKVSASDDYTGQTSDGINMMGQSNYIVIDGSTIRKAGRYGFNIYDGCTHVKILNTMILDVTTSAFNLQGSNTKIVQIRGNHITDTTMTNVIAATAGVDRLYFNENFYPASIATPINSTATNSDTTGNRTF